jgi:hypothetical protein
MKLLTGILLLILAVPALAQNLKTAVPKYDSSREQVFKGVVEDLRERRCPVSGGIGAHIVLRVEDNSVIEVHLATSEFTKMVEMNLRKNDRIEVTGFKTEFEGVPTIFARSVRRGVDEFVFRDKDGKPIW